ncbi:glycosyltransferase family 2 protein [Rhodopirellula europaea]|uniref:Glycosyl transferase, group 2 family protein n=1 Tax=Rhodopirellula europaea SH398 TaxID=1263868 RepID=M5RZK9_9BACT|nr:glycosyltransferase family 2 protein [Rhodopirellula europaea]EMI24745.1 glycosyl transferase, group 2 family protein [Rhodopirellula europaea SH398]
MKISVITAVYNRRETIGDALQSVFSQRNVDLETIVVDGDSNDGTSDVISQFGDQVSKSIREADTGIYNALNKGLRAATGDVIGFLHADDWLADEHVLSDVARLFADSDVDGVYADLEYVDANDRERVHRRWVSGVYDVRKFRRGWMPPHPTVFFRREIYERFGLFNEDLRTAADYELLVRMMVRHGANMAYLPRVTVKMRVGGASNVSLTNRLNANRDDRQAWLINGLKPPLGLRFTKPLRKLPQFLRR